MKSLFMSVSKSLIMSIRMPLQILSFILGICATSYSQEKLDVGGAIIIKNSEATSPAAGTIRFNTNTLDFEGWNGSEWVSMTAGKKHVKDIDNNSYEIVTIGTQTWMSENLRTTRYNDGVSIPLVTDNTAWSSLTSPAYTWYDNGDYGTPDYGAPEYGALYNYYVVATANSHNVCPTGWHVPTDTEWTTLIDYLDPANVNPASTGTQSTVAGGKMKEAGLAHWTTPNPGATNESGFTGLPGGYRSSSASFFQIGTFGYWWSITESGSNAWYRYLDYTIDHVFRYTIDKRFGLSVRCVKG